MDFIGAPDFISGRNSDWLVQANILMRKNQEPRIKSQDYLKEIFSLTSWFLILASSLSCFFSFPLLS